jgi:hypothetical protein
MKKILVIGLALMFLVSLVLADNNAPAKPRITPTEISGQISVPGGQRLVPCELSHFSSASSWWTYVGWYWQGEIMKNYFDPTDCPSYLPPNPYPFRIDSVWIPIYFNPTLMAGTYTFAVDVECADLTDPTCPYPGPEVCAHTFQVYYNGIGNYLFQDFIPISCCMDQPFFISLEFVDSPEPNMFPGIVYDTLASSMDYCVEYYNYPAAWREWHQTYLWQIGLGNWVMAMFGDANETCVPEPCPGQCIHNNPGDLCSDPILPSGTCWTNNYDLCDYCNDYDLSPCTGYVSNASDMVFKIHFTENRCHLYVGVDPSGNWDIALAVTTICGDFSAASCLAGEDENGAGVSEYIDLDNLPAGDYYVTVSGHGTNCGEFFIVICSNCQLPVELTSFAGTAGNREARLTWATASENDNDHFYLIRSTDNHNFVRVSGDIPGTNSATGGSYDYMDNNLVNNTTYYYKLVDVNINGSVNINGLIATVTPTANSVIVPDAYALHQNYPNPFNPNTTISYDIHEAGHVTLTVFDILGREVMTLVNQEQPAASYTLEFNASTLSSGIYFYQLKVNDFSDLKKMVVLK